jgi:hypothetical protein
LKLFWQKLAKLIDVKSIITFALTAAFVYLSIKGEVKPEVFMTIYTVTIGFYFGTQHEKNKSDGKGD